MIELRQGPVRDALAAASRVLPALSEALGADREVVIVPGNHDHHLLDGWLARRAADAPPPPLAPETDVAWAEHEPLAALARALAPARVRVCYPGVWLREDVYASHGHYLDRHTTFPIFERIGAGAMGRMLGVPLQEIRVPDDYEAALAPLYAWLHAVAQRRGRAPATEPGSSAAEDDAEIRMWRALGAGASRGGFDAWLRRQALKLAVRGAIAALNRAGIGPLDAEFSHRALRDASLTALGNVLESLHLTPSHAIFGHSHRAGPLAADEPAGWTTPAGTQLLNSGCWVREPAFIGRDVTRSPYRAGFYVELRDGEPPELRNALDGG